MFKDDNPQTQEPHTGSERTSRAAQALSARHLQDRHAANGSASSVGMVALQKSLLSCLATKPGDLGARVEKLSDSDWDPIIQLAIRQGVAPLLYHRLKGAAAEISVPDRVMQALGETYSATVLKNLRLYRELNRMLTALRQHTVEVVALKGAYLAQVVYGNIGLRPMVDIDLLVRAADLPRVEAYMVELRYLADPRNSTDHAVTCSHYGYALPEQSLSVEIHWNIEGEPSPFKIDVDGLWERSRRALIAGVEISVLAPEDLLLHLCIHTSFHHLFGSFALRSLCDIAETIRHKGFQMDWDQILNRSRQWGATNCVYLTLRLAKELLGADVRDEVLQHLEPKNFEGRFAYWAERSIFSSEQGVGPLSDNWGRLKASGQLVDRLVVLFKTCFPPPRLLTQMYAIPPGSSRVFLYYPVRLADLARRHAQRLLLLLRGDERTKAWIEREEKRVEEIAIRRQVLLEDDQSRLWIERDAERQEQLEIVRWLASA